MKYKLLLFIIAAIFLPVSGFAQSVTDLYMQDSRVVNAPSRIFGSLSLMESMAITATGGDMTSIGGNVEYEFYKSYGIGMDANYKRPYLMDDPAYNGFGDLVFYVTDRKLYTSKADRFDLSDKVNLIIPFSTRSQRSSLQSGVSGELRALKGIGKWNIMLGTEIGNYYYQYDTIDSTTQLTYNAPLVWGNRLVFVYNINRFWHWNTAGSIRTSYDYAAATHTQNMVTTGLGWDVSRLVSLDGGLRTTAGNMPGGGDTSTSDTTDPNAQAAGASPPNLFDAASTSFYMGLRVKL